MWTKDRGHASLSKLNKYGHFKEVTTMMFIKVYV